MKAHRGKALALGVTLMVAIAVSGCAGVSNSLGTAAGACFRALPPAKDAVHQGTLLGVRRVSSDTLADRLKNDPTLSTLPSQNLCVFAFRGSYPPGAVAGSHNTTTGRYAIVAVGTVHTSVVAVTVVNQLPTRFRHLH